MRVALCFVNFGPYHLARLKACRQMEGYEAVGVQLARDQAEYLWKTSSSDVESVVSDSPLESVAAAEWGEEVFRLFHRINPDVCAIAGYSHPGMLAILDWCHRHGKPAILMSDSTRHDEVRHWWKEALKRRLLRLYSTALVAGSRHREYLHHLGFQKPISLGYDVVDNEHFATGQKSEVRSQRSAIRDQKSECDSAFASNPQSSILNPQSLISLPLSDALSTAPFFLASARFIEKKNLPRLIEAYALYREAVMSEDRGQKAEVRSQRTEVAAASSLNPQSPISPTDASSTAHCPPPTDALSPFSISAFQLSAFPQIAWDLVLLGDGPLRTDLCALIADLSLQDSVHLPGFKQYDELPAWYARASAFVHASTSEQWGLVVNEACAAGLPVLVSNRCGCAPELVQEGVNGFTFDPTDTRELAALMVDMAQRPDRAAMGRASERIVSRWGPAAFAAGLLQAAELAVARPRPSAGWFGRFLLNRLLHR